MMWRQQERVGTRGAWLLSGLGTPRRRDEMEKGWRQLVGGVIRVRFGDYG